MKVLLTGLPKSGKSTMLADLVTDIRPRRGLSSPEVRKDEERIGFDIHDEHEKTAILARVNVPSDYPVGCYYVNLVSLERFIEPLFKYAAGQLLFIDEIGQMQLYSERFKSLVRDYLEAPNDFIGTISQVYEHPFIHHSRKNNDVLLCTVTPKNREQLKTALSKALHHRATFNALTGVRQQEALDLARSYLANDQYISLGKLFKNAIPYVAGDRINKETGGFIIRGNTNNHHVQIVHDDFACDCDFFNGRGQFVDKAGECSHIQAAKLFSN